MKRIAALALTLPLALGVAAFGSAAFAQAAAEDIGDEEWNWGWDDWELGEETVRDDAEWGEDWGGEQEFGEDEFGLFDTDYDWNVDDEGFGDWYGESDEYFEG